MEYSRYTQPLSNSLESSRISDISLCNQQKILKDDHSLEQIVNMKMRELHATIHELNELCENEISISAERTSIEFATFVKEKNNYVSVLANLLRDTIPSGFPKYRVEAYLKVKEDMEEQLQELKDTVKRFKMRKAELSLRSKSSLNRCKILQEVMEKSVTDSSDLNCAISCKLSEEKLNCSKQDMNYVLENVFPGNTSMKGILAKIVKANEGTDVNTKWIQIMNDMDSSDVYLLIKAGIVKKHPLDKTKITLVSFDG